MALRWTDRFELEDQARQQRRRQLDRPRKKLRKAAGPDFTDKLSLFTEPMEQELTPAYARLVDQVEQLNAIDDALIAAGVPAEEFKGMKGLQVPVMDNGAPAAYRVQLAPGVEKLVHTKVDNSIVPGMDVVTSFPRVDGSGALTTTLGDARTGLVDLEGHEHATEYIQDHLLQLAGLPVRRSNTSNVHDVDFTIDGARVDGEIRFDTEGSNLPVQVYTKVQPKEMQGMNKHDVKLAVARLMDDQFAQGRSIVDGVQALEREGRIRRPIEGKLLKDYDQLLMTKLPKAEALANRNSRDQIAIAPIDSRVVFLDAAYDYLKSLRGGAQQVFQSRGNDGYGGKGGPRAMLYARVPETAPGVSMDLAERFPHVAQLLR